MKIVGLLLYQCLLIRRQQFQNTAMYIRVKCAVFSALWLSFSSRVSCVQPPAVDYSAAMRQVESLIMHDGPEFAIRWPGVSEESQIIIQKGVARWIRSSRFKYLSHINPREILAFATVPNTAVWDNWADRQEKERTFVILSFYGTPTRFGPPLAPRIHGLFNVKPAQEHEFALWFQHVSEPFHSMDRRLRPS